MKPLLRLLCLFLMALLITGWINQAVSSATFGNENGTPLPETLAEDSNGADPSDGESIHDVEQRTQETYEPSFLENVMTLLMLVAEITLAVCS